jgi:hypothetical protein
VWGPDTDDPEPTRGSGRRESKDAGKSWLRLAAIVAACVLLLLVVVFTFNLGQGSEQREPSTGPSASPRPSESSEPSGPLTIAEVADFDPEGDPPEENSDLADQAIDDDPGTAWRTSTYFDPLPLQKEGVGLVVDLGRPVEVSELQLRLVGRPTDLELLAADRGAGLPTSTEELRQVAAAVEAGPRVNLDLAAPVTTRYLVVWLTDLPAVEGGFVGQIAEIVIRS